MKDDRKKFQEFAELAGRRKEHLLHRLGQPPKPESQVGQVFWIPVPLARVAWVAELVYGRRRAARPQEHASTVGARTSG